MATRERLAGAAFAHTATYDHAIAGYFATKLGALARAKGEDSEDTKDVGEEEEEE